jgi:hypothetical protein
MKQHRHFQTNSQHKYRLKNRILSHGTNKLIEGSDVCVICVLIILVCSFISNIGGTLVSTNEMFINVLINYDQHI